jgi:hypothetical protein
MTSKPPPIPPENRSDKGPGEGPQARADEVAEADRPQDGRPREDQGQTANTKINTTHQGLSLRR